MWLKNLKEWFVRTKVLKHLLLFTVVQIIVGVIWTKISYVPSVQLELVPLSERLSAESFWLVMLVLPIQMLLEELGCRYSVKWFMEFIGFPKKWFVPSFLIVATVWDAFLHQSNVIGGTLLGIFGYFVIQAVSGFYLAWIFLNKGLKASWFVHYGFDLLMFLLVFANV